MEEIAVPGSRIAIIEEFLPGNNTYILKDTILSTVVGRILRDPEQHTIEVVSFNVPLVPKIGDTVYAEITNTKDSIVAVVEIFMIENRGIVHTPFSGIIHCADVSSTYVKDIHDVMRIGDIVRAKVIGRSSPPFLLSTMGLDYGVILARCNYCLSPLFLRDTNLYCKNCRRVIRRKVSSLYLLRR
ncbi:MAG: hypothetical protein DRJ49_05880 [Thermoprotei archaeon]|nr:MAG: hypothetical protein DRN53_05600 [Thermoprotei archaeon]RLE87833.1 MAG: hypothetical protein DRJ49_05880 [Thermoprotei archaeon]